jgi:hypothetical protein
MNQLQLDEEAKVEGQQQKTGAKGPAKKLTPRANFDYEYVVRHHNKVMFSMFSQTWFHLDPLR